MFKLIIFLLVSGNIFSFGAKLNKKLVSLGDSCTTPKNEVGSCVLIRNCSSLISLAERSGDDIYSYKCGKAEGQLPLLCCPIDQNPPSTTAPPSMLSDCPHDEDRILGGNKTYPNQYPWMALLMYMKNAKLKFKCSGNLINKRYVLTAAHCVAQEPTYGILHTVRLGEWDHSKDNDCLDGTDLCSGPVIDLQPDREDIIIHIDYISGMPNDDIALIRLPEPVQFTKSVKPICLPEKGDSTTFDNKLMRVSGWGRTETDKVSNVKLVAQVTGIELGTCKRKYPRNYNIDETIICAGKNGADACEGDSGGPLMYEGKLVGIVSYGPTKCATSKPGLYVKVSKYIDWILENTKE